jgi:16S rRNA (uracil1498-N3)-methyltransferase
MQFLYHPEAGARQLLLEGEAYRYLFRVRRLRSDDPLHLRNLRDDCLYTYRTETLDRRRARIALVSCRELRIAPVRSLHLGWCQIDPRTAEKVLPALNEMGVSGISFIRCERSQRQFEPDFERLERILINSSQQCGRSELMRLESAESLEAFLKRHPEAMLLDFSDPALPCGGDWTERSIVIGCEGGFTPEERALFPEERIFGLETPTILRSETAVCAVAARLLLG